MQLVYTASLKNALEERAGCITKHVSILLCVYLCSVSISRGDLGWSVIRDCGIFWAYSFCMSRSRGGGGHYRHASETPFIKWRADNGPLIVAFGSSLPSLTKQKHKKALS